MLLISRSAGVLANHRLEGSFLLNHQEFLISQDSICGFQAAVCTHRGSSRWTGGSRNIGLAQFLWNFFFSWTVYTMRAPAA